MGRGNFCPMGRLTYQWYIDPSECYEDECDSLKIEYLEEDIQYVMSEIAHRFPSFYKENKYINHYWGQTVLLENKLFQIGVADNSWSDAIWISERYDLDSQNSGLAERQFENYKSVIQEILLNWFGTIYLRRGSWCSWKLTKDNEMEDEKNEVQA